VKDDRRLIEDFLPIMAINEVAQREKIGHAATHPRKLHLWWARRPLAAARAAVYATLVPAAGRGEDPTQEWRRFKALCRWGALPQSIEKARDEVLMANGGVPPRVLDMFAGGGAIPLEAARLGCEATAVELNPVAHLIERCMLEFPQRFPGLAHDVRRWGKVWVDRAWEQLADIYPPVGPGYGQQEIGGTGEPRRALAYLWTRTVSCPNRALPEHQAPLVRQTWLARKSGRSIALRPVVDRGAFAVRWEVVESTSPKGLGFDPADLSRRGHTTCLVCGASVSSDYVKAEGLAGRLASAPLAAVVLKPSGRGREYMPAGTYPLPDDADCERRLKDLDVTPPDEPLPVGDTKNFWVPQYGLTRFRDLFTARQLLTLCTLAAGVREIHGEMVAGGVDEDRAAAVVTTLALVLDRIIDMSSTLSHWHNTGEKPENTFARQALPMVWDFAEVNPFGAARGDVADYVENTAAILETIARIPAGTVLRGSATALPLDDNSQDAVITDPPYYDNISYADLSDFFYVWLKRSVGFLYPDDLGGELAPKRNEAVVAPYRHHGDRKEAREFYERLMAESFEEAHRVLKLGAPLVCIYAHKTTLGWSTLVEALRRAGFTITEAWPLDTEMPQRSAGQGTASLASSIFLVARKRRPDAGVGLENDVLAELDGVIEERRKRLTDAGISGSDLVIAMVGAGLRPFTQHRKVERANGEELKAERFLVIVQNRVLDAIFGDLAGADPATRFYVAAQFSYGYGFVPFDEANSLARMTGVELDGPQGLTAGKLALVEKKGAKVALRDFEVRGRDEKLGLPDDLGVGPSRLVDIAHGVLWRAEYRSSELKDYLFKTRPDERLLRSVIQFLAGKALRSGQGDGKAPEAAAAERLLGSWKHLIENNLNLFG
jgi:putative DNA methylase